MKLLKVFILALVCLFTFETVEVIRADSRGATRPRYHRVRKGESLGKIARRYGTSVRQLRRWNRMGPRTVLQAGKRLRVGTTRVRGQKARRGQARARYHRVRRGETLGKIARRYRTSVRNLRRWNRMGSRSVLKAGQRLRVGSAPAAARTRARPVKKIPVGHRWLSTSPFTKVLTPISYKLADPYEKMYNGEDYGLRIYAERFAQGHAAYVEIRHPEGKRLQVTDAFSVKFHDKKVIMTRASWGYRGFFAIAPNRKPGRYRLSVTHRSAGDKVFTRHFTIPVVRTAYTNYSRRVYLGRAENFKPRKPEIVELIRRGRLKKDRVFALNTGNKITSRLAHPRDMHKVTSPYYTKRVYRQWYRKGNQRINKKPIVRLHKGLDLRGRWGEPIFAMADGRVVCAERMHGEGNFTIIDHGNQIFTTYMHQSRFYVREGQFVRAGQKIGASGNTGASRGPHLHVELWINGITVNPLSILSLPVR